MDSITLFTLELWLKIIHNYRIKKETNLLKWVAFDGNVKPLGHDKGFNSRLPGESQYGTL